ncbi:hypothetical protein Tco_1503339 [Tanacetum coccineum]
MILWPIFYPPFPPYRLIDRSSNLRNFWDIPVLNDICYGWRKILQCRDVLREHIVYRIGDGSQTSLWYDDWLFLGPLSQFISKRDVLEAGLSLNCKVCDMVENGDWKWPDIWRSKLPFLFHLPPPLIIHGKNDMVLWKSNDGKVGNFLVKAVWSDLSVSKPSVPISVSKNDVLYFNAIPSNGIYEIDRINHVPNVNSILMLAIKESGTTWTLLICGTVDYALETATRILNMVLTKKVDRTPYELWYRKVPNLSYLKVYGYPKETMDYYFYFPPENKIVVARYVEFLEKNLLSREISRRAEELEKIQDEDTSPFENTSEISIEVEGFEPPQEEVVPIRRSARTSELLRSLVF